MSSNIVYRTIQEKDVGQVTAILNANFFGSGGEPLSQFLKLEIPRETQGAVDLIMPDVLTDGVSVVAGNSTSGEIAGIGLSHHVIRENLKGAKLSPTDPNNKKIGILFNCLGQVKNGVDIFEKYQVSEYVQFIILAVKTEYQRMGIAKQLVEKTFELARAKGIPLVVTTATSSYSKKIFDKMGFDTIQEKRYVDCMIDGKPVCIGSEISEHEKESLCAMRL